MGNRRMLGLVLAGVMVLSIAVLVAGKLRAGQELPFARCMNIGNALEAPRDMKWDVEMKAAYFDRIKEAGFDCVRLPVRFSDYAGNEPGYVLDEAFMKQVDAYVQHALGLGLYVILDLHHFTELMEEPDAYRDCFLRIWRQLAARYKDYSGRLAYELLNEPQGALHGELWNEYMASALREVRTVDAKRTVIVGPDHYNSIDGLERLSLPDDDHLLLSFHFYEPNRFTFQGNPYHQGFEHLKDIPWRAEPEELRAVEDRFRVVKEWAEERGIPVFMGEFGANRMAPGESRLLWTSSVRRLAEEMGFAWGYWELASGFGIFDAQTMTWDERMLNALLDSSSKR